MFGKIFSFETRKGFEFGFNLSFETPTGFGFGLNFFLKFHRVSSLVKFFSFETRKGFGLGFKPPRLKPERVSGLVQRGV